jgi:uncharacterized protein (TIGR02186 family)
MIARLVLALALLWPLSVSSETLVTSLSTHRVVIASNFTGGEIVVFGVIERDGRSASRAGAYDISVTVRGPRRTFVVREKERVGFAWINRHQRRFVDLPGLIAVLTNRPLDEITTPELRRRLRIGLDEVIVPVELALDLDSGEARFREALKRLEGTSGRFLTSDRGVTFLTPTVFRAPIPLPATAPTGNYDVEIALFSDSTPLARQTTSFELVKSAFEQRIGAAARDYGLLYGLATVGIAILMGWLGSVVFRRD